MMYEMNKNTDKAIDIYKKAISILHKNAGFRTRLAAIYIKLRQIDNALEQYKELARHDETRVDAMIKVGLIYFEKKRYNESIKTFEDVLKLNPGLNRVRYYLATAYEGNSQVDKATAEFSKIPAGDGSFTEAKIHLAYIYERQGRLEDTITELKEALAVKQNDSELLRMLASIYREAKQTG